MKKKRKKRASIASPNLHTGLISAPDVLKGKSNVHAASFAARLFGDEKIPLQIKTFQIRVSQNSVVKWDTVVQGLNMFIYIPNVLSPVGTKESFISLLEIAEEELGCENVICCIDRDGNERSSHMRTFMYMGFQAVPPSSSILPLAGRESGKFIFLCCEL